MLGLLKEPEVVLQHGPESRHFKPAWLFFSATTESGKHLLKELLYNTSKEQEALFIFVSRIPFQALSGFKWILVNHVGANLLEAATYWLLVAEQLSPEITTQKLYKLSCCLAH